MLPAMGNFRGWEWILILLLALLLFGGFKKLPDAARGVGRSLRIFKAETKGLADDDEADEAKKEIAPDDAAPKATVESTPKVEAASKEPVAAPPAGEDSSTSKS
jgi:sec-independent protein translocase protein TatA